MTQNVPSPFEDDYCYLFFRTDLAVEHLIVQTNHATQKLTSLLRLSETVTPNIIAIGLPNIKSLEKVLAHLKENQLTHYAWKEPDNDFGLTAIMTAPLYGGQRSHLKKYQTFKFAGGTKSVCSVTADSGTNSRVVVTNSTSPSKGEGVSENLTSGAISAISSDG